MSRRSHTRKLLLASLLSALLGCGEVTDPTSDGAAGGGGSGGSAGASGGMPDGGHSIDSGVTKDAATRDEDAGTSSDELCNGSSEMRLIYQSTGGFVSDLYFFANPYGHSFFAVDGMCRFYAGQNYMRGIASGTLSGADAESLSADVHWAELAGWQWDLKRDQSCADAGGLSLIREKIIAGCTCGCDAGAPKALDAALSKAQQWVMKLMDQGKPLEGSAVSAIAYVNPPGETPAVPFVSWPLSRSMTSIEGLMHVRNDPESSARTAKIARFDDAAEASKLREARQRAAGEPGSLASNYVPVEEGSMQYQLFVRDELPDAALKAWNALRATVPASP